MPERKFALEKGGAERVVCRWEGLRFNGFRVLFDGQEIGGFDGRDGLLKGGTFRAPDGSEVFVQLTEGYDAVGLKILRNGVPMPGSDADPAQAARSASGIVYFLGGLNLVLGVLAVAGVEILQRIGLGLATIVLGAIYLLLAFFTGRRSRFALGLAMVIYGLDGAAGLILAAMESTGGSPPIGGLFVRIAILMSMGRAYAALSVALPKEQPESQQPYR